MLHPLVKLAHRSAVAAALAAMALTPQLARAQAAPGDSFNTLYTFGTNAADGFYQYGPLVQGINGNLYSTNVSGGEFGNGTAYSFTPAGSEVFSQSLPGEDYAGSYAGLLLAPDGNFYGTVEINGADNYGTIIKLTPDGKLSTLYEFKGGRDGGFPESALALSRDGELYGTASIGGNQNGDGTIYKISLAGKLTPLYKLHGGTDGRFPFAALTLGSDGNFYGTTVQGTKNGFGGVYQFTPAGKFTLLYSFTGGSDGAQPFGGLTEGRDGNYYGVTYAGGSAGAGTAFSVSPAGTFNLVHTFGDGSAVGSLGGGMNPQNSLILGTDGNFYGTAEYGGTSGNGTVFEITSPAAPGTQGTETTLYSFQGAADGSEPQTPLVELGNGVMYGVTNYGAPTFEGTLYSIAVPALQATVPIVSSVTLSPASVCGGNAHSNGTVTLSSPAPSGGSLVALSSGDTSLSAVDPAVLVAPGATTAKFKVNAFSVAATTSTSITATLNDLSRSATLTITPPMLQKVVLAAASVPAGSTLTDNRVYLTGNSVGATTVRLTSSNPAAAMIPGAEIVLDNANSHSFMIKTGSVTTATPVTITATSGGNTATATLTVTPGS